MNLNELINLPYKVIDFETSNIDYGNAFDSRNFPVSVCLYASGRYLSARFDSEEDKASLQEIRNQLRQPGYLLVAHHAKFEAHWLNRLDWEIGGYYYDTMFLPYLQRNGRIRKGTLTLDYLSGLKFPLGDFLVHHYGLDPSKISPKLIEVYNKQDVVATKHLFEQQRKWLTDNIESATYIRPLLLMLDALPVFMEMEQNGFCVDVEFLENLQREEEAKLTKLIVDLAEYVKNKYDIQDFNANSPKQISEFIYGKRLKKNKKWQWENFFEHFNPFAKSATDELTEKLSECWESLSAGLHINPIIRSLGKTQLSVDIDTLKLLIRENPEHPEIETLKKFYEVSRLNTLIGTFINGVLGNEGKFRKKGEKVKPKRYVEQNGQCFLYTSYNQCVTATGRPSSSNPNMQNWPREGKFPVRHSIRSRFPGGRIGDADASQIELRYAGWYYNDPMMREDYERGIDIHDENTTIAFGPDFTDEERSGVKQTTFRVLYRGTAWAIVADPKIPIWEYDIAKTIVNTIYGRYKALADGQISDFKFCTENNGVLETPTGRLFRLDSCEVCKTGKCREHYSLKNKVANYPIQSGATADLMICSMISLHFEIKRAKLKSLLIGQVHDSFIIDIFPGEEDKIKELCEYALDEGAKKNWEYYFGFPFDFPLSAGFKSGETW